jgi:magnesium transporter
MIRVFYLSSDGRRRTDLTPPDFRRAMEDPQGLLWLDLQAEPPASAEPLLRETFGFHPLAIDDALQEIHVPKVDDWGRYLYIVLHAIRFHPSAENGRHLDTLELDVFLAKNHVVTYHEHPIPAVDRVWLSCTQGEHPLQRGTDYLTYWLADELVADYMPTIERMEETIDSIQDSVLDAGGSATLERILRLKRALLHVHRILSPQREVLNKLSRGDFPVVDPEDRVLFRDVYDHLVRLNDINENMRDLLGSVIDTYLSVVNNRMNDIMKTLTIITTLFMPMSFIVSFFGMNFFQPVERGLGAWTALPAFWLTMVLLGLAPLGIYLWIRRRGWIRRFR